MDRKFIKVALIGLIVFFFLPFFTVSCGYEELSVSGMELAFGKSMMGQSTEGNVLLILLLLLPAALLIMSFMPKFQKHVNISGIIASAISLSLLALAFIGIMGKSDDMGAEVKVKLGFYLSVIGHIVVLAGSIYNMRLKKGAGNEPVAAGENVGSEDNRSHDLVENGARADNEKAEARAESSKAMSDFRKGLENIGDSNLRQFGYLGYAGLMVLLVLVQVSQGSWEQAFLGLVLTGMAVFMYLKINMTLDSAIMAGMQNLFKSVNGFFDSIGLTEGIINLLEKLLYVFLGVLLINTFPSASPWTSAFLRISYAISLYGLFISVLLMLADGKYDMALHGILGYLGVLLIPLLRLGLFTSYKQINFSYGFKVLIYWTIATYMIDYVKVIKKD